MKSIDIDKLRQEEMLLSLPSAFSNAQSLQEAVRCYNTTLTTVFDKFAPVRSRFVSVRPNTRWYNGEIAQNTLEDKQRDGGESHTWKSIDSCIVNSVNMSNH